MLENRAPLREEANEPGFAKELATGRHLRQRSIGSPTARKLDRGNHLCERGVALEQEVTSLSGLLLRRRDRSTRHRRRQDQRQSRCSTAPSRAARRCEGCGMANTFLAAKGYAMGKPWSRPSSSQTRSESVRGAAQAKAAMCRRSGSPRNPPTRAAALSHIEGPETGRWWISAHNGRGLHGTRPRHGL